MNHGNQPVDTAQQLLHALRQLDAHVFQPAIEVIHRASQVVNALQQLVTAARTFLVLHVPTELTRLICQTLCEHVLREPRRHIGTAHRRTARRQITRRRQRTHPFQHQHLLRADSTPANTTATTAPATATRCPQIPRVAQFHTSSGTPGVIAGRQIAAIWSAPIISKKVEQFLVHITIVHSLNVLTLGTRGRLESSAATSTALEGFERILRIERPHQKIIIFLAETNVGFG